MIDAPLAVGFTAGMLAAFNPCGFAMLPAYVSFFVGSDASDADQERRLAGALRVGLSVTAGFAAVFGLAGVAVTELSLSLQRYLPWATLLVGLGMVPLGLAVTAGWSPKWTLPRLQRGGRSRNVASMTLFGISYATVSLSCTLPVFLAAVSTTFQRDSLVAGVAVFLAYAAGMGVVLSVLAVAMALARQSMVRRLRRVLPYVTRLSGLLLTAAGAYVAWYGWVELRLNAGADVPAGPVDAAGRLSGRVSTWINNVGGPRLGTILVLALTTAVIGERLRRRPRRQTPSDQGPGSRSPRRSWASVGEDSTVRNPTSNREDSTGNEHTGNREDLELESGVP